MHEITYFSGRPWVRATGFQCPQRSALLWLKDQNDASVTIENRYYIDGLITTTCMHARDLKPLAVSQSADHYAHHVIVTSDDWALHNCYSWTRMTVVRYQLWQTNIACIEDDTLAVQFKLAAPWENEYEQD
jgi:hypothetical protein